MVPDPWTDRLSEYLDGELEAEEHAALEQHLRDCESCATTLGELRWVVARAQAVQDRLPAHELWSGIAQQIRSIEEGAPGDAVGGNSAPPLPIPARPRRLPTRVMAFAASIAILLTVGVTVAPARDWIVERLAEIVPLPGGKLVTESRNATPRPAQRTTGSGAPAEGERNLQGGVVSPEAARTPAESRVVDRRAGVEVLHIIPSGPELVLHFDRHQIRGRLEVRVQNVTRASLWVTGADAAEGVHATPQGFRVRNSDTSATDYLVTVPASLRSVRIRIGNPSDEYVIRDLYQPLHWVFGLQRFEP